MKKDIAVHPADRIFPIPQKLELSGKIRDLSVASWIILPENAGFPLKNRIMETASLLTAKFVSKPRVSAGKPSAGELLIVMTRKKNIPAEGYQLELKPTGPIGITASDDAGFFYGMQTAAQLLAVPKQVPCCRIADRPALKERGYMLDVSRDKIPTMDTLKTMVRSLAVLRYNSLQLYMEHTFAFAAHERVWAGFTPFTSEEIMELDAFCRKYFIELVPNLNSFGHLGRWLCHEPYKQLAECDPPYLFEPTGRLMQNVLQPCRESLDFMDSLYAEFLPNFTSRKFNIGCDETVELGKGKSAELCRKKGVTRVYLDFLKQLAAKASARGFQVEFWGDIIMHEPELIKELPEKIIALEWGYEAEHPFERDTRLFRKSGVEFLVCPGTSVWNAILGRTANMIGNITNAVRQGSRNGARGILLTDWGDFGHHQYYPVSWPGIALGGGAAWNATADTVSRLPYGVSLAFAPGSEGIRLAEFLLEAGTVNDDFTTKTFNSTPFGRIMNLYQEQMRSKNSYLLKIRKSDIEKALKHTRRLQEQLTEEPFAGFPQENSELQNALDMACGALIFLRRAVGGSWDRSAWMDLMRHVAARHETLWLARNRSGGLSDSMACLSRFIAANPDVWKKR